MKWLLLNYDLLKKYDNVEIRPNKIKFKKDVINNLRKINYLNIIRNPYDGNVYIHARNDELIRQESIIKYISNDNGLTFERSSVVIDRNKAYCHNLVFFVDENINVQSDDKIKAIGGKHSLQPCSRYNEGNNPVVNGKDYDKKMCQFFLDRKLWPQNYALIFSPYEKCDNYFNGLHCFNYRDDKLYHINNDLPIIHGLHEGRYDGFYGSIGAGNIKNVEESRNNGISAFDGAHNILYDESTNEYILYARANISQGNRYIQYTKSKDLINWQPFNLINIKNNNNDILNDNYYYCNFFKIYNIFCAILPFAKKNGEIEGWSFGGGNKKFYKDGGFIMLSSLDGINWYWMGEIKKYNYEVDSIVIGKPILSQDGKEYYIYFYDMNNLSLYTIPHDRLGYVKTKDDTKEGCIVIDKIDAMEVKNLHIYYDMNERGYIKCCLLDSKQNIISEYTYENFRTIESQSKYTMLKWNTTCVINTKNVLLEIKFYNAKLYSVESK